MTKGQKIGVFAVVAVLLTAGVIIYKNKSKKKDEAIEEEYDGGQASSSVSSLWSGLSTEQTKRLQTKLNEFIQSGTLGEILGWLGEIAGYAYTFVRNVDGSVIYNYYGPSSGRWLGWCNYWKLAPNDGANKAYKKWLEDGEPSGRYYDGRGDLVTDSIPSPYGDQSPENTTPEQMKDNTDKARQQSAALQKFKESVSSVVSAGSLAVDGKYGTKTMSVVSAMQIYLNSEYNAGLTVDGKYGKNTDKATGWGIIG